MKVAAGSLQHGDVCVGSGETVISVSAGVRTPRGKVDLVLEKDGKRRGAQWNARTLINIKEAGGQ
jgi:hypothetical protein